MNAETVTRRASLSKCGTYRYTLERVWGTGGRRVLFIGLNPSTADARVDDPTVRRWIHFARLWGFDQFTAVNLYPFRSSDPAELRRWADRALNGDDWHGRDELGINNLEVICLQAERADLIVPCWGGGAWDRDWSEQVVEAVFAATRLAEIHCFGETASGDPMHPMARGKHRIPDDRQPILWRSV